MGPFSRKGDSQEPGEPARVLYDREDPQQLLVEGHARYRTDVIGGDIVVVVEDVA